MSCDYVVRINDGIEGWIETAEHANCMTMSACKFYAAQAKEHEDDDVRISCEFDSTTGMMHGYVDRMSAPGWFWGEQTRTRLYHIWAEPVHYLMYTDYHCENNNAADSECESDDSACETDSEYESSSEEDSESETDSEYESSSEDGETDTEIGE